ncbi:hypothetical protein NJG16_02175 [Stenotrophomonas maltophilia]|nr:hypothetical protein [Stenotrophomonas maltophilia]
MKAPTRSPILEILTDLSVGLFFALLLMVVGALGVLLVQDIARLVTA